LKWLKGPAKTMDRENSSAQKYTRNALKQDLILNFRIAAYFSGIKKNFILNLYPGFGLSGLIRTLCI
jgi:hypothetical protein